jgi:hypothetical protein
LGEERAIRDSALELFFAAQLLNLKIYKYETPFLLYLMQDLGMSLTYY